MTITLTLETEARLRERAARDGQDANTLAEALLADALSDDPDELPDEEITELREGIRRGMEAVAEGRERTVAAYAAEVQQRRAARTPEVSEHV